MAVAKKARKAVAKMPKIKMPTDGVFYVVVRRGFAADKLVSLHTTRELADASAERLDSGSSWSFNVYTVQRVELAD